MTTASAPADRNAIRQGVAALRDNRPGEAERIARGLLARHAGDPDSLHLLGLALLLQQRAGEAIAPLQQAAAATASPIVETHCAAALRTADRVPEALTFAERAAGRQPPHMPAFLELGIVYATLHRYDDAERTFKHGLELDPNATEMVVELGGVYICRVDPANAKLAFARALAQMPDHLRALHGSGTAFLLAGEFARAAERFRHVLAREPGHVRARLDLAHCLIELGRWDEAIADLSSLVAAVPQARGDALKVMGSSSRGRFWLRPSAAAAVLKVPAATATGSAQAAR